MSNTNGQARLSVDELRKQVLAVRLEARLIQEELRLSQARGARKRRELRETTDQWDYLNTYQDLLDRFRSPDGVLLMPISIASDRLYGANWPMWKTWTDHAKLRGISRLMVGINHQAQGAIGGLQSYVVGECSIYRATARKGQNAPKELVMAVQGAMDEFTELNEFDALEGELFANSRRDGEYFLRSFPETVDDLGALEVRVVDPAYVVEAPGKNDCTLWESSFGVLCKEEDVQKATGFTVSYTGGAADTEDVDADEMIHVKIGVDRAVKRGCPDFVFDTYDTIKTAARALENMGEATAIQSAIAMIRQHGAATQTQAQGFQDSIADYQRPDAFTGANVNYVRAQSGTVYDIPQNMTYVEPPFSQGVQFFGQVVQMLLRVVGVKWNAPEWLLSGDASNNNYSSSITAESPFVKTCKRMQKFYTRAGKKIYWRAIKARCESQRGLWVGRERVPWEVARRLVDIQAESPTVEVRNILQEAQANQVRLMSGWKSRQTIQQEEGLDTEQEFQNEADYQDRFGRGGTLPVPGDGTGEGPPPPEPRGEGELMRGGEGGQGADGASKGLLSIMNAVAELQAKVYAGELPRTAAIANVQLMLRLAPADVAVLFPDQPAQAPVPPTPQQQPATESVAAGTIPDLIRMPDVRQHDDYSCGACEAMSAGRRYGVGPTSLSEWKKALGTTVEKSTSPQAIVAYLQQLGLEVHARQYLTLDDLYGYWERGWPVLIPCQDYMEQRDPKSKWDYGHWLIYSGGPALGGYLWFQDSSADNVLQGSGSDAEKGLVMIHGQRFLDLWHDTGSDGTKYVRFGIAVGPGSTGAVLANGVAPADGGRAA